jgi:hypothetical protein
MGKIFKIGVGLHDLVKPSIMGLVKLDPISVPCWQAIMPVKLMALGLYQVALN